MMRIDGLNSLSDATNKSLSVGEDKITTIPDRMYFRIGDVAEIVGVQPYVLRFWEKEFDFLVPIKNASGQRLYRKGDVESVLLIKKLLYMERYSIEGAKKRIKELRKEGKLSTAKKERAPLDDHKLDCVRMVKDELRSLIDYVS
ncbi:MAG: MerR family transcriptional regulator [Oligoflexia bacterium]|nr:MerR family transcriptional regulator [Oligoflexia bacterium]